MPTLGDVPGLFDMLPNGEIQPIDPTVVEVNSLGEVIGTDLGDITMALGEGYDPFAFRIADIDDPDTGSDIGSPVPARDPMVSSYLPTYSSDGTATTSVGVGSWDAEQTENAETIARVGKSLGASSRDIQIALMAAIVESGLRNLDYGDRDSLGLFQQRDAWGSSEDRTTPAKAAEMFFLGGQAGQRGLLDIEDRGKMSMGEAAQAVQVSAYPDRYAEHEAEAAELMGAVSGGSRTTGSYKGKNPYDLTEYGGKTVDYMTAAALDAAAKELGGGFRIMQGSHNHGGVAASGGTHDGGGVVDLAPENGDWEGALTALRKIGFAAWIRNMPGYGSAGSGAHIHAVLIGNEKLSPQAAVQVNSYLHNDDGLVGSRPDDGPRQFVNNRFVWGETQKTDHEDRMRAALLKRGRQLVGTPFKWGGEDLDGLDISGFLKQTYGHLGIDVPAFTDDWIVDTETISVEDARPGDLIAWTGNDPGMGLYLGGNRFIEVGGPDRVVQISELGRDALTTYGIPMEQILRRSTRAASDPLNRPAPFNRPAPQPQPVPAQQHTEAMQARPEAVPKPKPKPMPTTPTGAPPNKFFSDMH